jgi:hypothetical protein
MRIRREDKEAIRCMAFVGAVLGACLGPVLILNQSRRAHEKLKQNQQFLDINASVLKIDDSPVTLDQLGLSTAAVGGVLNQLQETESEIQQLEQNFWVTLPQWTLIGMCVISCACGVVAGYHVIWIIAWTCSFAVYKFIRAIYKLHWQLGGEQPAEQSQEDDSTGTISRRNTHRIMPTIIKLILLTMIAIFILAFIMYYLTAIRVPGYGLN